MTAHVMGILRFMSVLYLEEDSLSGKEVFSTVNKIKIWFGSSFQVVHRYTFLNNEPYFLYSLQTLKYKYKNEDYPKAKYYGRCAFIFSFITVSFTLFCVILIVASTMGPFTSCRLLEIRRNSGRVEGLCIIQAIDSEMNILTLRSTVFELTNNRKQNHCLFGR